MDLHLDTHCLARWLLHKGLAVMYLLAFLSALRQFPALLGTNGLLPVPEFLANRSFKKNPSLFHWHYSDALLRAVCWTGIALSCATLTGLSESGSFWLSLAVWLGLWLLYLSVVNVGQTFYGFGWESMLLEAGFLAAFLGPDNQQAPLIPIFLIRWMLFRVEFGAGLIKLRHDDCWRDLTCLNYHYQTQPLPNPLSWHFHHLPKWFHKASVAGSHVVQLVLPFGLFGPQPVATVCAALIIFHQLWLIVSGNYSWLNWLTVVLGCSGLGDSVFGISDPGGSRPLGVDIVLVALALLIVALSVEPAKNLVSKQQRMNCSYNPLRLVNSYGAFGNVTRDRFEVVLEGTAEKRLGNHTEWREYEFKCKPTDPGQRPRQTAPYHHRLDWQMWFLPFSARVVDGRVRVFRKQAWFFRLVEKLLEGDPQTLSLLGPNPFPEGPPTYIRARYYLYRYTSPRERAETGCWWKRELKGLYLRPGRLRGSLGND